MEFGLKNSQILLLSNFASKVKCLYQEEGSVLAVELAGCFLLLSDESQDKTEAKRGMVRASSTAGQQLCRAYVLVVEITKPSKGQLHGMAEAGG